jgi:hypothetical protein
LVNLKKDPEVSRYSHSWNSGPEEQSSWFSRKKGDLFLMRVPGKYTDFLIFK